MKGVVDTLCGAFRVPVTYVPSRHPSLHPGRTAEVHAAGQRVGVLGQLHPAVAARFDLDATSVLVAELDFERLLQAREPLLTVQTPSRFPPADRDIAIVVDEDTPHADVEAAIREAAGPLLENVQLFDVYRGRSIPEGRKSLASRCVIALATGHWKRMKLPPCTPASKRRYALGSGLTCAGVR